jgi:cyclophilin family peptidyl-prolyl cis-trans isomerase/protein-disulfide isomerase
MPRSFLLLLLSVIMLASCSPEPGNLNTYPSVTSNVVQTATPDKMPCTLLHFPTTPEVALGAEFESRGHISGPTDAPVTIIAFSDYQCLECTYLADSLRQIRSTHPNDVRLIYLHAPQLNRDKDGLAIQAVEAADLQGKFWEMHDLLFEKHTEWSVLVPAEFETWVTSQAADLGMDVTRFQADFGSPQVADRLQLAIQFMAGVKPFLPPLLFVNSTSPYTALADFASLDTVVRLNALTMRQFSDCPPMRVDKLKQYIVTLHTSKGDVVLQLFPEKAPKAVNNFIFLARNGWYDEITFYRVLPEDRVMTGDPSETGLGNPGYLFETEISAGLRFDQPGMVAMDNDGPDTNGSRFFINLARNPQMDGQYTIFGQVLSGLDIFSTLTTRNPQPGVVLPAGDELISVSIEERQASP